MPAPTPTYDTSQNHLDIQDIVADLLVLKGNSACLVLEVSAINFGLLSEKEQDATIYAYAQLLNSLTFPIQIVIISKQKDITDYIRLLDNRIDKATAPLLKDQLIKYRDFVRSVVRQGNVLDKKFYVVIPFSTLELGAGNALKMFSAKPSSSAVTQSSLVERAAVNLTPKRDHLIRLLARIGLKARQLDSNELLQLFFETYNRDYVGVKVKMPQ
ncbi:hypothetical protein A2899_03715 [Candidatus Amesbacteria bacterium RIFCSPLOWO2_01_FULL_49_25]|uniref:Uncharacterized protein n=1 Tax=Candidatus Amesbacteria bacterium RIFCSPHIGHO2_01_FULL_48_32b TaxID=1797253 RepID=A0A1F4YGJ4_9BACT|nr:MAG: hypothetical protein A2876_01115 [Candidatus Amesbacteria bacterium RIFCSPHIGHO2_01_FULL_48_32b]OGD07383.1 MAG: hypothetical protein A2899_03715 [Candidatus Amesbacteria bacterium RIFCSPLOWO2_01_FULL_49_25]